ncbi:MAG: hypothetical protein AAB421_02200 [Patescibacteria group bacterium]
MPVPEDLPDDSDQWINEIGFVSPMSIPDPKPDAHEISVDFGGIKVVPGPRTTEDGSSGCPGLI